MSKAVYAGVGGITQKVKKMYIGVPTSVGMSRNLLKQRQFGSLVHNGISFVQQADGGIRVSGTASADASCNLSFIEDSTSATFSYPNRTLTASATEKIATLAIKITQQPVNQTVVENGMAVFTVTAEGEGLTYQWQWTDTYEGWSDSTSESAKTNTLTVEAEAHRNGYQYRCVISDAEGNSLTSEAATLTLLTTLAIKITKQPENVTALVGSMISFSVEAEGEGLIYQWWFKNTPSSEWKVSGMAGSNTANITLEATEARNGYQYRCVISDAEGNSLTSEAATLTIGEEQTLVLAFGGWDENGATVSKGTVSGGRSLTFEGNGELARVYLMVSSGATVDTVVYPQLELGSVATDYVPYGEEYKSIARKVKKAYIGVGGVARQFYSAEFLTYDGEYEALQVEYEGKICDLYRLKKSGILTLNDDALFWMCGGGKNGNSGGMSVKNDGTYSVYGGNGGASGYLLTGEIASGENWVVTVGAGGSDASAGASSITDGVTTYQTKYGSDGASGYGAGGSYKNGGTVTKSGGKGTGESTIPFGIGSLKKHCAGGAGGFAKGTDNTGGGTAGKGGSNGSNGGDSVHASSVSNNVGGDFGGGSTQSNATFYGGGGGGANGSYGNYSGGYGYINSNYGAGYQGVVYILDYKGGVAV